MKTHVGKSNWTVFRNFQKFKRIRIFERRLRLFFFGKQKNTV
jgi:hypothetical protein